MDNDVILLNRAWWMYRAEQSSVNEQKLFKINRILFVNEQKELLIFNSVRLNKPFVKTKEENV